MPSHVIDAGPEVVAVFPLDRPIAIDQDPGRAAALLVALAERLGADVESAKDLGALVPFCGIVRGFGTVPPHRDVEIVEGVDPTRRYTIEQLEAALMPAPIEPPRKRGRS